jgi:hypothetical protein
MHIDPPVLHTHTALAEGGRALFHKLEVALGLRRPINVYLAGGMAVHLYTASRVTSDVDAEFGARVLLPPNVKVAVILEDGSDTEVYLDTNYNPSLGLMHEDYDKDSIPVDVGLEYLKVRVLSPVDLAVSKISRLADNDKEDMALLVRLGLASSDAIHDRAMAALGGYVGNHQFILLNIRDAIAKGVEAYVEAERRLERLHLLEKAAGPAFTFWRNATEAISANGWRAVDWAAVERQTIHDALSVNSQVPGDVADALCLHSPGAVAQLRQDELRELIERDAAELLRQNTAVRNSSQTPDCFR